jgi:hypothetical protein
LLNNQLKPRSELTEDDFTSKISVQSIKQMKDNHKEFTKQFLEFKTKLLDQVRY